MARSRRALPALAAAATIACAGCADPYATNAEPSSPPGQEAAPPPTTPDAPPQRPAATPEAAARRAATLTGTWTATTHASRHARFAREAIGQARADAEHAAARSPARDLPLRAATSIAAVVETRRRPQTAELALLARERQQPRGGQPATRWRVIQATVTRHERGWVVSRWASQP